MHLNEKNSKERKTAYSYRLKVNPENRNKVSETKKGRPKGRPL